LGRLYLGAREYTAAFDALRQAAEAAPGGAAQRYAELFEACDQTVAQALDAGFSALADLESPTKPAPREEVYQRLHAVLAQIRKIKEFATPLKLPEDQQLVLDQRILYYAAAFEAVTWALDYVDTGAADSQARALQRRAEAAALPAGWAGKT
jgi:predicted transcriptional regulator